jgi:hypothetical protein
MAPTSRELILSAMDRHAIAWPEVFERVRRDEDVSEHVAEALVHRARTEGMPLVVAAAIITLIAEKREVA